MTVDKRIVLERREHSDDSNKDILADLETVNLTILDVNQQDQGYYVCIVANSLKSFRVTYAFLNIVQDDFNKLENFKSKIKKI